MKLKKILRQLVFTVAVFALSADAVLAKAGTPYSPYKGHEPTDTALGGLQDAVIIGGILFYILGLAYITLASKFKQKINA
jgi:hypothetical protein